MNVNMNFFKQHLTTILVALILSTVTGTGGLMIAWYAELVGYRTDIADIRDSRDELKAAFEKSELKHERTLKEYEAQMEKMLEKQYQMVRAENQAQWQIVNTMRGEIYRRESTVNQIKYLQGNVVIPYILQNSNIVIEKKANRTSMLGSELSQYLYPEEKKEKSKMSSLPKAAEKTIDEIKGEQTILEEKHNKQWEDQKQERQMQQQKK